jgi:hypothetical protein
LPRGAGVFLFSIFGQLWPTSLLTSAWTNTSGSAAGLI